MAAEMKKMKRRDVLKGAAAVAGVAVVGVPEVAEAFEFEEGRKITRRPIGPGGMSVTQTYSPKTSPYRLVEIAIGLRPGDALPHLRKRGNVSYPHSNLVDRFEMMMLHAQEFVQGTPVLTEKVGIQFFKADGSKWLPHPTEPEDEMTVEPSVFFVDKRWTVMDRARQMRMVLVWRAMHEPYSIYGETAPEMIRIREEEHKVWRERQTDQLHHVRVRYFVR
jgi:hypothetical protein